MNLERGRINSIATERSLRHINGSDFLSVAEGESPYLRQTCAKLPTVLVDQVDEVCVLLEMHRRDFIERALWDALDEARRVIEAEGLEAFLVERTKQMQEAAE